MPKKGHAEEQIVAVLRQADAGEKASELCRKVGISDATGETHVFELTLPLLNDAISFDLNCAEGGLEFEFLSTLQCWAAHHE